MTDSLSVPPSAFIPVVPKKKPAALFGKPVDAVGGSVVPSLLQEALVAEAEKVGVEPAAMGEGQDARDLAGVMPAAVTQRFKHQALQLAALPHRAIVPRFVSTFLFVTGTRGKSSRASGMAKACPLQTVSRTEIFVPLSP